jgi:hydroxymethylpyrimidine pyrophosphatase-like HAD family hydrolase
MRALTEFPPSIRLVCLDFDGTLMVYDEEPGFFHPELVREMNTWPDRGIAWCTNSGRSLESQLQVLECSRRHGLTAPPLAVLAGEALIYLREQEVYRDWDFWNERFREKLRELHRRVQVVLAPRHDWLREHFAPESVVLTEDATAYCVNQGEEPVRMLSARIPGAVVSRNGAWLSIVLDELGKGNLLQAVQDHLGLPAESVLAVGDHLNDLAMLTGSVARHVGCPADAAPEVVEAVRRAGGRVAHTAGPLGTLEILRHYLGPAR